MLPHNITSVPLLIRLIITRASHCLSHPLHQLPFAVIKLPVLNLRVSFRSSPSCIKPDQEQLISICCWALIHLRRWFLIGSLCIASSVPLGGPSTFLLSSLSAPSYSSPSVCPLHFFLFCFLFFLFSFF